MLGYDKPNCLYVMLSYDKPSYQWPVSSVMLGYDKLSQSYVTISQIKPALCDIETNSVTPVFLKFDYPSIDLRNFTLSNSQFNQGFLISISQFTMKIASF